MYESYCAWEVRNIWVAERGPLQGQGKGGLGGASGSVRQGGWEWRCLVVWIG